jgi:hypothetical protein
MALSTQFVMGNTYTFNTFATAIIGIQTNVTILGIVDHETANIFNDVVQLHSNVYPSLPQGTVEDDFRKYNYLLFKTSNGTKVAYGLPWIVEESVEEVGFKTAHITIPGVTADDVELMRKSLIAIGKTPSVIELK